MDHEPAQYVPPAGPWPATRPVEARKREIVRGPLRSRRHAVRAVQQGDEYWNIEVNEVPIAVGLWDPRIVLARRNGQCHPVFLIVSRDKDTGKRGKSLVYTDADLEDLLRA
jgi:hypothetical protein